MKTQRKTSPVTCISVYPPLDLSSVHNMTTAQRSFRFVSYRFSEAVYNLSLATVG